MTEIKTIKQYREALKLTREETAKRIGISASYLNSIEAGARSKEKTFAIWLVMWAMSEAGWRTLKTKTNNLTCDEIGHFYKSSGLTFEKLSKMTGMGKATVENLKYPSQLKRFKKWHKIRIAAAMLYVSANSESPTIYTPNKSGDKPQSEYVHDFTVQVEPAQEPKQPLQLEITDIVQGDSSAFEKVDPIIIDGQPWWIVADVCRAIDHSNPSMAINLARKNDLKKQRLKNSKNQMVEQWTVNEFGLFRILAKSNLPKAEPFERWVFEEVLPSIRKTGAYQIQGPQLNQENPHQQALLMGRLSAETFKAMGLKENQIALASNRYTRKATGIDLLAQAGVELISDEPIMTPTMIGKHLKGKDGKNLSPQKVNSLLEKHDFQYSRKTIRDGKIETTWFPSEKGASFAVIIDTEKKHKTGAPVQQLKWKRSVIHALLNEGYHSA